MPIYQYRCEAGHSFEEFQEYPPDETTQCPVHQAYGTYQPSARFIKGDFLHEERDGFTRWDESVAEEWDRNREHREKMADRALEQAIEKMESEVDEYEIDGKRVR